MALLSSLGYQAVTHEERDEKKMDDEEPVSYTHLRAHET